MTSGGSGATVRSPGSAHVHHQLVEKLRVDLNPVTGGSSSDKARTYRTKHGTTSTMNTRNVGKGKRQGSLDLDPRRDKRPRGGTRAAD
jgi:hypothetical protein